LVQIETASAEKCSTAVSAAANEISLKEAEKKALQTSLFAAQAQMAITNQLKLQVEDKIKSKVASSIYVVEERGKGG
jgi:hypothetical protein